MKSENILLKQRKNNYFSFIKDVYHLKTFHPVTKAATIPLSLALSLMFFKFLYLTFIFDCYNYGLRHILKGFNEPTHRTHGKC